MEKESVKKFDLEAAFKALDEIEIPQTKGIKANRVDLKERFNHKSAHETLIEDYYDVSSTEDLEEAKEEREGEVAQAKLARIEKIVDLDAETADDLLPSYVGKVIMQCPQCMTLFYKNPEDIEHSEENPDVVNINEVCQHCGNTSGYTLIGKVDSVSEEEADKYDETSVEENELDLDFEEPTEEVDAEGTGEGAEEMSGDEELSEDELKELELDLEDIPEEEPEDEKKEESLNLSTETSENETEHKSENLTLNEEATDESLNNSEVQKEAEEGSELKTENESENLTLNEDAFDYNNIPSWNDDEILIKNDAGLPSEKLPVINYFLDCSGSWQMKGWLQEIDEMRRLKDSNTAIVKVYFVSDHIYNNPNDARKGGHSTGFKEVVDYAKAHPEEKCIIRTDDDYKTQGGEELEKLPNVELRLHTIGESLTEEVDKDLDAKLKAHNDYIAYLQQMIKQEEEALKKAENDEIKAAIQRRLDAFTQDLHDALPDVLKDEPEANEVATEEPVEEMPTEAQAEEEPKTDEPAEEEAPVEEQLTEEAAEEEKPAEGNEVDYVEYKHSYCHALAPKLKAINYLVNVKKVEPKILKGYILKLLKDADVKWTEKEKEFKKNIETKEDNYDILNYVKNSIEKAKTIKVKVDENGELVEGLNEGFEGCLYEVLTESLNKSEETSEHKTENESENLTLNEGAEAEIDSIIASWDFNESLTEEGNLDKLLDSDEFKTPVSEEEIDAARKEAAEESLEECNKPELSEGVTDPEIDAIINSWGDVSEACEGHDCEEGYTGNPAERTTHLEYTDDDPTDGKAVLPDNIEKQLTEGEECADGECEKPLEECGEKPLKEEDEVPAEEAPAEEPTEEESKEELPEVEFTTSEVKEVADNVAEKMIDNIGTKGLTIDTEEWKADAEEVVADAVEEKIEAEEEVEAEEEPAETEEDVVEESLTEEVLEEGPINAIKNALANKTLNKSFSKFIVKCYTKAAPNKPETKEFGKLQDAEDYAKAFTQNPSNKEAWIWGDEVKKENVLTGWANGKRSADLRQGTAKEFDAIAKSEKGLEKAGKKALDAEPEKPITPPEETEEAPVKEAPVEETPKPEEEKPEETSTDASKKLKVADILAALEAKYPGKKNNKIVAAMLKNAGLAESLDSTEAVSLCEAVDNLDSIEDLNEEAFNTKISEFLTEVYSNVKSFTATECQLIEEKLVITGKIGFNSGNEKLTVFEFLPNYGDGHLFFEGYNKDFSEDNAFTLNYSINESKELITESFGYKYKINETLVEGLK